MPRAAALLHCVLAAACASQVGPVTDAADAGTDARQDATIDATFDALHDAVMDAPDISRVDAGPPVPCGLVSMCGPGTICIRARCLAGSIIGAECIPIPRGCTGELRCDCFADDPCGGCSTCRSVGGEGIRCVDCRCFCAAPWTPIDTPDGPRAILDLRVGDRVYSVQHGGVAVVRVAEVARRTVAHHAVARIVLGSGAVLEISGGHPTADGRRLDALAPGDLLGSETVASVEMIPYTEPFTFDILPDSESGAYFVHGALVGSTLATPAASSQFATPPHTWTLRSPSSMPPEQF